MSLHSIYLREFVQSVPSCGSHESLKTALNLLRDGDSDRLVLVNLQQQPLGLIHLHQVLPYVLEAIELTTQTEADRSLATTLETLAPSILPLPVLPERWSLAEFFATEPVLNELVYAVVNQDAQFVGLLDGDRLLTYLAKSLPAPTFFDSATSAEESIISSSNRYTAQLEHSLQNQQQQIVTLTQQLLAQRAELEQRIKTQQEEIVRLKQPVAPHTNALLQLLERLPLPLMLQTNEGQVLAQNAVWCQQVGELSDPAKIWREAAVWLGVTATPEKPSLPEKTVGTKPNLCPTELAFQAGAIAPLPLPQDPFPADQSMCQVGTHPDSCVCVCPLKDGREQVVQFIKIPLGTLLPNLKLNWTTTPVSMSQVGTTVEAATANSTSFQLATLTPTTPDPATPTISQATTNVWLDQPAFSSSSSQSLWLVMAQDVTQQQHLARELTAKNADLVQLNRLKDEFLACISHELKTPLTAVLGLSSLLKDQTLGELNQRQVHYAQLIHQSSRHLMGVVNDILDLTRIETGQLELLYGAVNIPTVCQRAFEQTKQLRSSDSKTFPPVEDEETNIQFSLDIEPGLNTLIVDDLRLRQMLVHLLSNSLKFTEDENPIGLRVSRWGGWIAFTVWDTGIGIPAEKQHLIFQKFQQLENPLTRRFEGAGLGLVLTRRLARLHGGDVTFLSKEGTGSQFTILLPPSPPDRTQLTRGTELDDEDDTHAPIATYPNGRVPIYAQKATQAPYLPGFLPTHGRDRLVLIVDAVAQFLESLTEKLTGFGYRVVVARSGTEALEKARRLQPSVIFLNPLLPLLSGWDVLTLLKSGVETRHLPVVLTATVIDEERAYQNQANGFLTLPVQTSKLQTLLQQLISGTRPELRTPASSLTILHLLGSATAVDSERSLHLNELLKSQPYRILESDDLAQAELLAGVWKPNVVLLEGAIADPTSYLQQLSHYPILAMLPIVTLDAQIAQAANQIAGLQVFPCLLQDDPTTSNTTVNHTLESTLLQVIQIAAGCVWQPFVLAIDVSLFPQSTDGQEIAQRLTEDLGSLPKETEWLQALMQYLQTAGMEGIVGQSWQEVMQQVQSQNVDVLLLCWTHGEPQPETLAMLAQLHQTQPKPPIIVLDHRDPDLDETTLIPLPEQVRTLATHILAPPIRMSELLEQIQHTIQRS